MGLEGISAPSKGMQSPADRTFLFPAAGAQHLAQPVRAALRLRLDQHPPGLHSGEEESLTPIAPLPACPCCKGYPHLHPYLTHSWTRLRYIQILHPPLTPVAQHHTLSLISLSQTQPPLQQHLLSRGYKPQHYHTSTWRTQIHSLHHPAGGTSLKHLLYPQHS